MVKEQREILNRIIYDENFYKKEDILLGILERDGNIRYTEFEDLEVRGGWLYKDGLPFIPLHRVVEIRTKSGEIIWIKFPAKSK